MAHRFKQLKDVANAGNEVFDVNWRWNASFKLHVDGIMQV